MERLRKPKWLTSRKVGEKNAVMIAKLLRQYNLYTVCEEAKCPNRGECFSRGTATFMILGERCTRNCTFCAVDKTAKLLPPDEKAPQKIAELSKKLNLKHVVVTTVTRDDLPDGGASQFVAVINEIKKTCGNNTSVEVLTSDLKGNKNAIKSIVDAKPDVYNHNIETTPRLYPKVRPMAIYKRSLDVLQYVKTVAPDMLTKSGFMVGLGETETEVYKMLNDLMEIKVDIVTIGQYMQPSSKHYPVYEYVHPDIFEKYKSYAEKVGFKIVESAPLVRSSYQAEKARNLLKKGVYYANHNNSTSF